MRVEHCGVCHSDVHIHDGYFDLGGGAKLPLGLPLPHTLGHEVAGEVIALGPDADRRRGRRAPRALFLDRLRRTAPPACAARRTTATQPRNLGCSAGDARRLRHPRAWSRTRATCIDYGKTPPALAATYMCSGLTAYGAMKKVPPLGPKDDVLVVGAGGVGMMGIQFAKHLFGKGPLVADIDEGRLQAAMGAGAKAVYNTKDPEAIEAS